MTKALAVGLDTCNGEFVRLDTQKEIDVFDAAGWPVVRWNESKQVYEQKTVDGDWCLVGK